MYLDQECSSSVEKKWGYLHRKEICLKWKNNVYGGFSELVKILFIVWRWFGWFYLKKVEATEGRDSVVTCGKTLFEGEVACENPIRLTMYDGPVETVEYICVNTWCMIG